MAEEEDVEAALAWLHDRHPALPLWTAGFSFGARVGLAVGARHPHVDKLLGIGLALPMFDYRFLSSCSKPKAVIQGSEDELAGRGAIEGAFAGMAEPKRLWIVDDARVGEQADADLARVAEKTHGHAHVARARRPHERSGDGLAAEREPPLRAADIGHDH